jgi:hypothetical protein
MREKLSRLSALLVTFYLFSNFIVSASDQPISDGHNGSHEISAEEIVRGERLFYGLVYMGEKSVNCASCHNARVTLSDTINWNPDAYEIAKKYEVLEISQLEKVLLRPAGQRLSEVHKNFELSTEDIVMIKAYLDVIAEKGLIQPKPVITELILFIFALILVLFSLTDLLVTRKVSAKWVHAVIILGGGFFITQTLVEESIAIGRSENYSPDQPVKFSHAIHAGQNQTECLYCHASAEYSKSAGFPGTNVCMNCHLIVRNGSRSGAWEINKVIQAYEEGEAIEWIRVHNNPDHVFFSHAQHVSIGGIECQECHGEVESMDRIIQVSDLSMGWCIDCHRENKVNFHTNEFYSNYENLRQQVRDGEIEAVTVDMVGGIECMKCHY